MKMLMISLDKQIALEGSRVADRMEFYGKQDELFILVPDHQSKAQFQLGERVHVEVIGGSNKMSQWLSILKRGNEIVKKYQINYITVQDPFFIGLLGVLLKLSNRKVQLEIQLHGDLFSSNYYKNKYLIRYCLSFFIIKFLADKVRVASHRNKESLIQKLNIDKRKVRVKPVIINYQRFANYRLAENVFKKRYPGAHGRIFLWLGRMEPVKNLGFLIEIFKSVVEEKRDWILVLVGEGSNKQELIERVKNLGLEKNIFFESWTQDPAPYYKSSDCVLLPSLSEGYSLVAMEAHEAGVPVIMTDVGVANYELKPGPKVTIIPVNDKEKFEQAILSV